MKINMSNSKVIIDGREFTGRKFEINGDKVIVDGIQVDGNLVGNISISVYGDVESIETTNGEVNISGNSGDIKTVNGNVSVTGDSGNIKTVNGNITTKSCTNSHSINGIIRN